MKSILRYTLTAGLFILIVYSSHAQQATNPWSKWDYLLGEWIGDGKGDPGEAKGWFTLKTDLDKNVLVRTNHAEYPATKNRPAAIHEDLMIVYAGNNGASAKAIYFDNEKHIINYTVSYNDAENAIVLTSDVMEGAPRFRFTYKKIDDKNIKTVFEIAPPGKPDSFAIYVEGTAHRK
jgi:hypothetical protein